MDGTLVGHFEQFCSLFFGQRSIEMNIALNPVDLSDFGLAVSTIGSVDLRVPQ
ncbi:MAG: hypothetical protein QOF24_2508 [Verrucomicrobiota bacterium]